MAERIHPEGAGGGAGAEIRPYQEADLKRIEQIHAKQGFDYPFPDLSDPAFALSAIAEDGQQVQAALFGKITAEMFLFLDPGYADPLTRWQVFLRVHEAVRRQALEAGLDSVTCWLPPNLPKAFQRRLRKLGWGRDVWEAYSFRLR